MSINPRFVLGSLDLTYWPFAVEFGSDLGNPENAAEVIDSLMQDGEIVSSSRSSNRALTLPVLIDDSDMLALADAEALLLAECDKQRNALAIDPGDGIAAVTVFDTFRAQVQFARDDDEEINGVRRYVLTIPALPFGRSDTEITTVGVTSAATPTTVVVNDGSSTTNWTKVAYDGGTASAATSGTGSYAGAVEGDLSPFNDYDDHYYSQGSLIYSPTSPIDMSATSFLQVDWGENFFGSAGKIQAFADGVELAQMSEVAVAGTPYTRTTFMCSDASVASLRIKGPQRMISADGMGGPRGGSLYIDQMVRTNQAPSTSTLRQKVTSLTVEGSARTQGSLVVSHPSSALGYTMVHTYPDAGDGYTPDLRRWLTSSPAVTTDSSLVSGARQMWNSGAPSVYTVPLRILRRGPYLLMGRLRRTSGTGPVSLSAGGVTGLVSFASGGWQVSVVGVLEVADHLAGTAASLTLTCSGGTDVSTVEIDELWLFYVGDDASLTRIDLGAGTPSASGSSSRLFIDTPTLARPYPSLWRGTLADKSDARNAVSDADAWGDHRFAPPQATVFTVTVGALDAQVSLKHFPRWHTHARRIA